jgi:hypothetical protein
VGLSGKAEALVAATGVSSFPVSPAFRARSGDATRPMPSNTAANTRIPFPPENEVQRLVFIHETELKLLRAPNFPRKMNPNYVFIRFDHLRRERRIPQTLPALWTLSARP